METKVHQAQADACARRGLGWSADFLSNVINGYSNPAGLAYKNVTNTLNGMGSALQVNIYNSSNTSISIGINPFAIGLSGTVARKSGNYTYSSTFGVGALSGPFASGGISYQDEKWGFSVSAGGGANYYSYGGSAAFKGYGAGYYQTNYGDAVGPDGNPNPQTAGGVNLLWPGGSFRIENDFLAFKHEDRWRSNAVELTIGNFTIGTNLYNNDPEGEGAEVDSYGTDRMGNSNKGKYSAWTKGQTYSSPIWFGYNYGTHIERFGYSHPAVQDRTQNFTHRNGFLGIMPFGHANFFNKYDYFKKGFYGYGGYNNSFSLWGR